MLLKDELKLLIFLWLLAGYLHLLFAEGNLISCETRNSNNSKGEKNMGTILIVILVLILIGALPTWPHSNELGILSSGGLGLILLILIILLLMGRI